MKVIIFFSNTVDNGSLTNDPPPSTTERHGSEPAICICSKDMSHKLPYWTYALPTWNMLVHVWSASRYRYSVPSRLRIRTVRHGACEAQGPLVVRGPIFPRTRKVGSKAGKQE